MTLKLQLDIPQMRRETSLNGLTDDKRLQTYEMFPGSIYESQSTYI